MSAGPIFVPGALKWYVSQHRWPNEAMYHYTTSRDALKSILAKRQMWATDLREMNDPEELRYGRSLIEERMRRAVRRAHNEPLKAWLRTVYELFVTLMADKSSSFAISLSEYPDLPSQWRNYAAGGQGFVLGWSIDSSYVPMPLQTWVTYERKDQKALIDGLIQFHVAHIRSAVREGQATLGEAFANTGLSLAMFLNIVLQTFKHKNWASESEFRYVYQLFHGYEPPDVYKTRLVGGTTTRYIEADFSTADLLYVVVGPRNDFAPTALCLRDFLDRNGFQKTKIVRSGVTIDSLLK